MRLMDIFEGSDLERHAEFFQYDSELHDPDQPEWTKMPAKDYDWTEVSDYPVSRLFHLMSGGDWAGWLKNEIAMYREEGSWDNRESEWEAMIHEPIREPIVLTELSGLGYLWDGWHRTAATIVSGRKSIPAIVGTPKVDMR